MDPSALAYFTAHRAELQAKTRGCPMCSLLGLAVSIVMAACAVPYAQKFAGPGGKPAYLIQCGDNLGSCIRIANKECPDGWNWIDSRTGVMTPVSITSMGLAAMPKQYVLPLPIQCK